MISKLHLAVEQGQKPRWIVVTAGQRGDSPQFEPVLEKVRVPRIGVGRPRARPNRVRVDKAYASRKNRAYLRRRGIRCTIPDKADQAHNRRRLGSRGGRPPRFEPGRLPRASCGGVRDQPPRGTAPWPRDATSSRSATRRPSSSRP
ncbi:transposase [Streptomyces sp. Ru62]|uniref:transposase n=1 Tax=Streptomyces sp. Ru62 TaxID=2080745 RepID=UPI00215642D3|nr:transposase [Streptomyces sp. Ru62]